LLIASGQAQTKASIGRATGLPRSSISSDVEYLMRRGVLKKEGPMMLDRGRPAEQLTISPDLGVCLVADIGVAHGILSIADLSMNLLLQRRFDTDLRLLSPLEYLTSLAQHFWDMFNDLPHMSRRIAICVLGLPARIDVQQNFAVRPPNIPQWDAFDVVTALSGLLECPVILEDDANLRALGEAIYLAKEQRPIFAVKIGTGIGAGIVDEGGSIFHGYDGAAGEIGHIPISKGSKVVCGCGKVGCLEAVASVTGMINRLHAAAPDSTAQTVEDLISLVRAGDSVAKQIVHESGLAIGEVLASMCNAINPRRIVVSGLITQVSDNFLADIRTSVYQRARPLATRNLIVSYSAIGELAGTYGAMALGIRSALGPGRFGRVIDESHH